MSHVVPNQKAPQSWRWAGARGDLATSMFYVFPLFLIYEIGVMFTQTLNGADFITRALLALVSGDRTSFLLLHLALAGIFVIVLLAWRRQHRVNLKSGMLMVIESAIYAITIGSVIVLIIERILPCLVAEAVTETLTGTITKTMGVVGDAGDVFVNEFETATSNVRLGATSLSVITSLGAGVYEELVFRLGLFFGGASLLLWWGTRNKAAWLLAAVISSVLFSAAHHLGPYGEMFEFNVFTFRLLAGLAFAAICYWRSFAHAVYSHFLYDVYVLVLHP